MTWASAAMTAEPPAPLFGSHWEGYIQYGESNFQRAGIHVDFAESEDGEFGKIYYSEWGETTWPITALKLGKDSIEFRYGPDPATSGVFSGTISGKTIHGKYTWKGNDYPFALGPPGQFDCPIRRYPQMPKPLFPYRQERISFRNGDVTIGGILTIPSKPRRYPAVVQIDGSGVHTADPQVPGHPWPEIWQWLLSDSLARAGIATLRLDSRGVGGSTGSYDDSTLGDLAADVGAAVQFLRGRQEINPWRIGLLGMSEGAMVAPLAAVGSRRVSFVVLIGAPGIPFDEMFLNHYKEMNSLIARNEPALARKHEFDQRLFELCKSDMSGPEIIKDMKKFRRAAPQYSAEDSLENTLQGSVANVIRPLFRSELRYDPGPTLRNLRQPVLVVHGEKDLQVPTAVNVSAIEKALADGINSSSTVKIFPGLEHGLRKVKDRFKTLNDDTIDPEALEFIKAWIMKQALN